MNCAADEDRSRVLCGCGIDIGTSLSKIVAARPGEELVFTLLKNNNCQDVVDYVMGMGMQFCGVTGGGALEFKHRLHHLREIGTAAVPDVFCTNEFASWGTGVIKLLPTSSGIKLPYLLGSIGTGTSILLVNGYSITRVGGSALGGGTILGLGRAVRPGCSFEEICELASQGKRCKVDLLLRDIYAPGEVCLAGNVTASNFGRLSGDNCPQAAAPDVMAGIMGLVGENIALIASGLMNTASTRNIVYAGTTLRHNPALCEVLIQAGKLLNHNVIILERGEFTGAVGAYQLGLSNWETDSDQFLP